MADYRIRCAEIWGGVNSVDMDVSTSGLAASLYSQASGGDIGGDIYYLSVCSSDRLTRIALADVRGHGERVSSISTWIYESLQQRMNTLEGYGVLSDLNTQLHTHGYEAMTTASVVGYYRGNSNLYFSYAGHSPALVWRTSEGHWRPLALDSSAPNSNMVLGVLPTTRYDQGQTPLERGDRLFLYTDGLVDCRNKDGQEFGEERVLNLLATAGGYPLDGVKRFFLGALFDHARGLAFEDDLTFMIAEVR